jgi:hypothetical protein
VQPIGQSPEPDLLDGAVEALTSRIPRNWRVEKASAGDDSEAQDLVLTVPSTGTPTRLLAEARRDISTRDVEILLGGPWKRWRRQTGNQPILFVAPYIGPRVRELLTEEDVSYIDLTGNIRISLDYPGVFHPDRRCEPRSTRWEDAPRNPRSKGWSGRTRAR